MVLKIFVFLFGCGKIDLKVARNLSLQEENRCYNRFVTAPKLVTERGCQIGLLASFILSIMASVVAYYICKWLDGDE